MILCSAYASAPAEVLFNEIMYHPASELTTEEYIELRNTGTNAVNLQGWSLDRGVSFTFSNSLVLPPGGLLVVAADTNAFHAKYPAVTNYTGNWGGVLNNTEETLRLSDSLGATADEVFYADEGDYAVRARGLPDYLHRGWDWQAEHDGLGKSLERLNPALTGKCGQNWASSTVTNGTPGLPNSTATNNIAPMIDNVAHYPLAPLSTNPVTITARLTDEQTNGLSATLHWRNASYATLPSFTAAAMFDDGAHGDGLAGDRLFGAVLAANTNGAVIEFYVSAADAQGHSRTWPAPARETNGAPIQVCNALFQVDNSATDSSRPSFRLVMTKPEYDELYSIPAEGDPNNRSHAAFNGTFVSVDGTGAEVRYNCSFRNRGEGSRSAQPPNYRVNVPSDRRWKGLVALNLNSQYTHCQVAGAAIAADAGLPTELHRRVQLRVNGNERAASGSPQFGSYVFQETVNSDFAANHWPADGGGNLYRGTWSVFYNTHLANLNYIGTNYLTYITNGYTKNSNLSENDWSDLFHLADVLSNSPTNTYWTQLQQVANVDEWVRFFAVFSLIGSEETSLGTGYGDDFTLYRGLADTRFNLVGHDWDTILNQGSTGNPTASIFRATGVATINRFLKHPEVAPRYYGELYRQINGAFAPGRVAQMLDQTLSGWIPAGNITTMKTFATNRCAGALAQIPLALTVNIPLTISNGYPRATIGSVTLNGQANAVQTRSVLLAGAASTWSAWEGRWTNTVALFPGINSILIQSLDASGAECARTNVLVWYDDGGVANVGGSFGTDTTWTAAGGPYSVASNIIVSNGVTLTIQPGTTLYFGPGVTVTVNDGGRILANGTASAPIRFTTAPGSGAAWGGLTVNGSAGSPETQFAYTHFESNSTVCINVSAGTILLDHVTFGARTAQYLSLDGASFLVQDSVFPTGAAMFDLVHGTGGIKTGGRGIFLRNFFGSTQSATTNYNDVIDFTGGNRPGPILHILDNVFAGGSDDLVDLDGTDAWIEGNIFMHAHKNGAVDTSSAISGGSDSGNTSEITVTRNFIYDCDHAALAKQGNFYTFLNNTIVRQSHQGGLDTEGALLCLADNSMTEGAGAYFEGNVVYDIEALTRNRTNALVTFTNNLMPLSWSGPGGGNSTNNPLLKYLPAVSETTNFTTWAQAQVVRDWFSLKPGSPAIGTGPNGLDKGAGVLAGASISGEPPAQTPSTGATLTVGTVRTGSGIPAGGFPNGSGYTHYKWRLDNGSWSAETPATTPIALAGLGSGTHHVDVAGKRDSGTWQDAAEFGLTNTVTASRTWTVNTALPALRINEVLARNWTTLVTNGESPDLVELYNAGAVTIDLSGKGLSDNPSNPWKFTFPAGSSIAPGQFKVLFADNGAATNGYLGFNFGQNGGALYLTESVGNGGALLESISFGPQITDFSIGRLADGSWGLCQPTFGAANTPQAIGNIYSLKINEWLASGAPTAPDDFVELYNPDPAPVALGGLYLSDAPDGAPARHCIAPLSFIAAGGWFAFKADGNTNSGAEHLNFRLSPLGGSIGLSAASLDRIDCVVYGPQSTGISQGRTPNGASTLAFFSTPTPGSGNPGVLPVYVTNITHSLVAYTNSWRYNQSGTDLGTAWRATNYNDSAWSNGVALFAYETTTYPVPFNTTLKLTNAAGTAQVITYYFRTMFNAPTNLAGFTIQAGLYLDDGAIVYVNGVEAGRVRLTNSVVTYSTLAINQGSEGALDSLTIPASLLVVGTNYLAVEVHQSSTTSSDIVFGMDLTASIAVTNYSAAVLNEVCADNASHTNAGGMLTDWVEIYNPSAMPFSLAGYSLSDDVSAPGRWVFPAGVAVAPGGFLVVYCDSTTPASTNNGPILYTGFGLSAGGDEVCLFTPASTLFDSLAFGPQAADFSLGRVADGRAAWSLALPTPGTPNIAAVLGDASAVRINEWAASVTGGPDWFELYNPAPQPVALGGLYLTDALASRTKHQIAPLSFLGVNTNGWRKFIADNDTAQGPNHVSFQLSPSGEALGLFPPGTAPAIDSVTFGPQTTDISEGRFPDGAATRVFFTRPSPGDANWLYLTNIVINEVLTHTDLPLEDAIELRNLSGAPVNVSGWFISDDITDLRKFQIPNGTVIPAYGHKVFYEYQINPSPGASWSFSFSSAKGDEAWLIACETNGAATGYRDTAKFGPQFNGVSFGRFPTSVGADFTAMSALSLGTAVTALSPTNQINIFRSGSGAANAYPRIGPVVISEIMYQPPLNGTNDNTQDEFVELHNISGATVPLYDALHPTNGWRLRDAVDFDFNTQHSIPAGGYLLVVGFDPLTNASALASFRAQYGTNAPVVGPWSGKLSNNGETVELKAPDNPQTAAPDIGLVPYVMVDRVAYSNLIPWPTNASGTGVSLQRVNFLAYGNEPTNWIAALPNAGLSGLLDSDGDGMPDTWEDANGLSKYVNDANLDPDNDRFTNIQEYLAGTDPHNANSCLRIEAVTLVSGVTQIRFTASVGRTYSMLYRDGISPGGWLKLADVPAQSVSQAITIPDSGGASQEARYYRLVTPQMP